MRWWTPATIAGLKEILGDEPRAETRSHAPALGAPEARPQPYTRGPNRTPEQRTADAEHLKLAQKARGMKPRAKPKGNSDIDLTISNRRLIALKNQYMELVEDDKKVAHTPCVKKWIKWNR
jgi:hypothetical protein